MATDIISFNLEKVPKRFVNVRDSKHNCKEKIYVDGVNLNGIVSKIHSLFEQKIYSHVANKKRLRYAKRGLLILKYIHFLHVSICNHLK